MPFGVQADFAEAVRAEQILTSPLVKLELLYGCSSAQEFDRRDATLGALRELPLTKSVGDAAIGAFRDLKTAGPDGYHKVNLSDALIAASAAERAFGVLHYDRHYERLEQLLTFHAVRPAPTGSLS